MDTLILDGMRAHCTKKHGSPDGPAESAKITVEGRNKWRIRSKMCIMQGYSR